MNTEMSPEEQHETYQRSLCPECRHSFVWHSSIPGGPRGCGVDQCFCDATDPDESAAAATGYLDLPDVDARLLQEP